jgi:hypothetical protein
MAHRILLYPWGEALTGARYFATTTFVRAPDAQLVCDSAAVAHNGALAEALDETGLTRIGAAAARGDTTASRGP